MANKGKRMVNEDLIKYLEAVKANNPDPSDIGGGGTDFTATNGLLLQEIEGENYLGIDPAASIHFTGNYNGSIILDTSYINANGFRNPLKFNIANNTAASMTFGHYDGGDTNLDYGAIIYERPNYFNQRFVLKYQGELGSFAPIYFPKSNSTSFTAGSGAVNVAVGAKAGTTTIMADADGLITLPNSSVEKKLYYATIYMTNLDSGVSFLTDNDYSLCVNHPEYPGSKPFWDGDLYESGDLSTNLTSDEKTKIYNILMHIPTEPYDNKIGGIVTNYTNNTIILSGTFKSYGELSLFYLTDNNGTLSMTTEDINIIDGAVLRQQLDTSEDIKFSIIQIL